MKASLCNSTLMVPAKIAVLEEKIFMKGDYTINNDTDNAENWNRDHLSAWNHTYNFKKREEISMTCLAEESADETANQKRASYLTSYRHVR